MEGRRDTDIVRERETIVANNESNQRKSNVM